MTVGPANALLSEVQRWPLEGRYAETSSDPCHTRSCGHGRRPGRSLHGRHDLSPDIDRTDGPARRWNGPEGANWAKHSERATPGGDFSADVLEVADLDRAEHVLDIGCGIGTLTRDAARVAVDGHALGVDLSAAMIERARARSR